jgi:phosphatidylethanolamine-binding protein (PEBP) family uncharacterized protein
LLPEICSVFIGHLNNLPSRVFTLRALDALSLKLPPKAKKADVERAMKGHVLGEAKLMGIYQR